MKSKINLGFLFEFYAVIMVMNTFNILLNILWLLTVFYTKPCVLIYLNKIEWLSIRINILLKPLTILIHGKVPRYFLGDVVLTACYLINRISSSVLDKMKTHSTLFPYEPLHLLPLKVLRSTCFVNNFSHSLDNYFLGRTNVSF